MFYNPNGARELHFNDRSIISGHNLQTKLLSNIHTGYRCIQRFETGRVLLFSGGISE